MTGLSEQRLAEIAAHVANCRYGCDACEAFPALAEEVKRLRLENAQLSERDAAIAKALHDHADLLDAVPVDCTALTGPLWYGRGWHDAAHHLHDLADGFKPSQSKAPMPRVAYSSVWAELVGYVTQARDDAERINPVELLAYLAELKHRALAPVAAWMRDTGTEGAKP